MLNIDKTIGDLTLSSTTSYYDIRQEAFSTFGSASYPIYPGYVREDSKGFSQELRLLSDFSGPLNFMVGAYYDQNDLESFDASMPFLFLPTDPASGLQIAADSRPYNDGVSWSVFGQLMWDITPEIELSGGARYTHEERRGVVENSYVHPAMAPFNIFLTRTIRGEISDNDISPEVTLSWRPRANMTIYAAYKTGYKSGGFSTPQVSVQRLTPEQIQFGPEQAEGFEIGAKGRFLNGRLLLNATAYDYEFEGLQLSQFDPVTVSFFIRNAASAVTRGVEVEGQLQATENLSLRGTIAYNDAHFKAYPNAPCWTGQAVLGTGCVNNVQDLSGGELPRAPEWVVTAGFSYERPLTDDLTLQIHGDAKYSDDYAGGFDGNPFARPDSYTRIDARVGVASAAGWSAALIGRNLTNEKILLGSGSKPGGLPGELGGALARPREVALQLSYRFD